MSDTRFADRVLEIIRGAHGLPIWNPKDVTAAITRLYDEEVAELKGEIKTLENNCQVGGEEEDRLEKENRKLRAELSRSGEVGPKV